MVDSMLQLAIDMYGRNFTFSSLTCVNMDIHRVSLDYNVDVGLCLFHDSLLQIQPCDQDT